MKKSLKLLILIGFYGVSSFAQNDSSLYSFFIAGHSYGKPGVNNEGLHPPFKQKFGYIQSRTEIKFGVLTGDIVSANPIAKDWDEIDADIKTLGLPVYFTVGNHDMENRPVFESRYDSTFYKFKYQNDLFIVLDPNIDSWNISGVQLQFLKDVLNKNASTTDNIFVFFHQILWKSSDNQFDYIRCNSQAGRATSLNFWTEIEPLFSNLPNDVFMFSGDLGASWSSNVTYDHYNNITLIASGMGDPDGENFVIINVDTNKSVNYDLICLSDINMNCLGELTDYLVVNEITNSNSFMTDIKNLSFYPNPATTYATLTNSLKNKVTLELFDIRGELLRQEIFNNEPQHTLHVRDLPKGMYIARISNNNNQATIKLVIE